MFFLRKYLFWGPLYQNVYVIPIQNKDWYLSLSPVCFARLHVRHGRAASHLVRFGYTMAMVIYDKSVKHRSPLADTNTHLTPTGNVRKIDIRSQKYDLYSWHRIPAVYDNRDVDKVSGYWTCLFFAWLRGKLKQQQVEWRVSNLLICGS